jgi:hypothetical protein
MDGGRSLVALPFSDFCGAAWEMGNRWKSLVDFGLGISLSASQREARKMEGSAWQFSGGQKNREPKNRRTKEEQGLGRVFNVVSQYVCMMVPSQVAIAFRAEKRTWFWAILRVAAERQRTKNRRTKEPNQSGDI